MSRQVKNNTIGQSSTTHRNEKRKRESDAESDIQCKDPLILTKSKKLYHFNPPNPVPSKSTNKPRFDDGDINQLKPYYYIKISDAIDINQQNIPDKEYEGNMKDQSVNKCLNKLPNAFEFLKQAINQPINNLLNYIWNNNNNNNNNNNSNNNNNNDSSYQKDELQIILLIKYILTDFHANCLKPPPTATLNERTPFCESIVPIFKYFSSVTGIISFIWYEKSSETNKQLMIYLPGGQTKLFDGVGSSVKDKIERIFIECSGNEDGDHTVEDSLKLLECTSKCLQLEMMNYRSASFDTFKKRCIIGIQVIGNKITLTSTKLGDNTYYYVEQRSALVPRNWEDRKYWIRLLEFLLKLKIYLNMFYYKKVKILNSHLFYV
ncbi:unnamed protein product [Cunninghamella blakesleeana]